MLARDHHYLFTHTHLRNQALRNPEKLLFELSTGTGEAFLFFLWQQVEEVAAESISGAGLGVEGVDSLGGGTLALIRLPAAQRPTESIYAALYVGPGGARYFVFDRSAGDDAAGTLAELELDDTRINLGRHAANKGALLSALVAELAATPAPHSQPPAAHTPPPATPPIAGTVAMNVASMHTPPPGYTPPPMGAAPPTGAPPMGAPPMGAPPMGAPKKRSRAWMALLLIPLLGPIICCGGIGLLAYDAGLDPEASFEVTPVLSLTEGDAEQLVINIEGPEEVGSYSVTGPGAEGCEYLSAYSWRQASCTIDLSSITDASPSYRVVASGHGPQMFGENIGDRVTLEQTLEVNRNPRLEWSAHSSGTVVRGFPGRLDVTRDGFLRLIDAPPGATLVVGPDSSAEPTPLIGLDLLALSNQVGVLAVLRDGGRISLAGVTVRLTDGTQATGTAELNARDLGPALAERLSLLGEADLGEAGGEATLWLQDGRLREVHGSPRTVSDVGRVIVVESREATSGRCGPYSLYGIGYGNRIPRTRWMTSVTVYDRVEQRREARRRFRGDRPSCPQSIPAGTRRIHGVRDTVEADAWAREHLSLPEET